MRHGKWAEDHRGCCDGVPCRTPHRATGERGARVGEGIPIMTVRVRVPASSSNLGGGFDCVGVAVDRWLVAAVTPVTGNTISIRRGGRLTTVSVAVEEDLLARGFRAAGAAAGAPATGAAIDATSDIPVGCGLGSSSPAIVSGGFLPRPPPERGPGREKNGGGARPARGAPPTRAPPPVGGAGPGGGA